MPDAKVNCRPPTTWRYCGNQLKLWRTGAGISRDELADAAGGKLRAAAQYLHREKFPDRSQDFMAYEAAAVTVGPLCTRAS